jgi:hypothetical protein
MDASPSYRHRSFGAGSKQLQCFALPIELPKPLDLSHHYSEMTKHRIPSNMKMYYKFFQIPGIGNLAGGT